MGNSAALLKSIEDPLEGRSYGEFWQTYASGGEDIVHQCKVTLPSGQQQSCKSLDEFDALTKLYMGGN